MSADVKTPSSEPVHLSTQDGIRILEIDNPPVNALSTAVRKGMLDAITAADGDASVKAVLIVGRDKGFIAGADIREFGKPPQPPSLPDVCNRIEACAKPVVAAIHGPALGGGLEVAMSAHYRIATPTAKLGLPEVQLGLLPGAGGTQRAPRLMGVQAAAEAMLSGKHLSTKEAMASGLVDRIAEMGGESSNSATDEATAIREAGLAYAKELVAQNAAPRRTRDLRDRIGDPKSARETLAKLRDDTAKKSAGLFSPMKILEAIDFGLDHPFDEALANERDLFKQCLDSPQRAGLIHAFMVEREVAKAPEVRDSKPRAIDSVGVIGGGTMGAGIAVSLLDAGLPVTLIERDDAAIEAAKGRVAKVYEGLVAKGRMTEDAKAKVLSRLKTSTDYASLSGTDLVIEAVFEELSVKETVFRELDRVMKPGSVLATNTSYLDVGAIADMTKRPQDVIGLHFFSPANIMKLLEIVVPPKVAPDVVATAFALAKKLRKVPVRAGVCDGFIGNRILAVYRTAADYMMEDGASPYDIDAALRKFGFAMGPYQVSDLAGGDIGWATRKRKAATRDPKARYVQIADRICERGWFGQKTGRGYYLYEAGSRSGKPDPEVLAIIDAERERAGIKPRSFTKDEIIRRYMAAMVNESAKVVEEGIALRPLDVDGVFVHGYGFPRWRGGPMKYADMTGLSKILADIREFAKEDADFWKPAALLEKLVNEGKDFESLNQAAS